jgi:thiaminase/transcriptional activator TenA
VGIADDVGFDDQLWQRATRHDFLVGVRDGTITTSAFDTWLEQDYLFVGELLTFQAGLLARAPRHAQPVLGDGCVALVAELGWFEAMAKERSLTLPPEPSPATRSYGQLLHGLAHAPVDVALASLYVVERVYLDAWRFAAPGAQPYRPFVAHWTTAEFGEYVGALAAAADRQPIAEPADRAAAVSAVLRAEVAFWDGAV